MWGTSSRMAEWQNGGMAEWQNGRMTRETHVLQNTTDHDSQIRHLVFCLENAVTCLPAGRETMLWLIDFRGWSLKTSPPLKTSRETLNILQNHYPERLGMAVLYNPPTAFEMFFKVSCILASMQLCPFWGDFVKVFFGIQCRVFHFGFPFLGTDERRQAGFCLMGRSIPFSV